MQGSDTDVSDFERLLHETYRMVYKIANAVLLNAADAEDVTQEAFLRAYQKFSSLRDPQKFRPWVARMSWRLALNRRRSDSRARGRDRAWFITQPTHSKPQAKTDSRDFELRLREEIDHLPEKLRSVVLLSAVEGLAVQGVAEILKIPEGTVRSRMHLARRQLMRALFP